MTMAHRTRARRKDQLVATARAMLDMDTRWAAVFGDLGLSDLNYSDLFSHIWLSADTPLSKSQLIGFMPGVSPRTTVKYVQSLIENGLLIETVSDHDRRIRYVTLSPLVEEKLKQFLGYTFERFAEAILERPDTSGMRANRSSPRRAA